MERLGRYSTVVGIAICYLFRSSFNFIERHLTDCIRTLESRLIRLIIAISYCARSVSSHRSFVAANNAMAQARVNFPDMDLYLPPSLPRNISPVSNPSVQVSIPNGLVSGNK